MFSSQWLFLPVSLALLFLLRNKDARRRRLPPGPPPVPLLGNIRGIDIRHPWKTYSKWCKEYGNIIYTRFLDQDIIVVNSEEVARNLLERRSHNYSSRPASVCAINEFFGTEFSSIFLPYGDRWRLHRRFFHQAFHSTVAPSFGPTQIRKVHDLIMRLMSKPHQFQAHLKLLGASLIMSAVYGYEISGPDDDIAIQLGRGLEIVEALPPAVAAILSTFPSLKYLPAWFPGAKFKRQALIIRSCLPILVDWPFEYVKKNMREGTAAPSMVLDGILRIQDRATTEAETVYLEKEMKEACASAYSAASETTYSTLMIFCLVMTLYPDVQARAQAEIDSVIGKGLPRLPQWEDRSSLPYVEAVLKETLRWYPAVPLGIPHATVNDDFYEGYYIPKGATVVVNAWAIAQDPTKFPEPQKFKPERFLQGNDRSVNELTFAFGFGRRVCVGRHVADASLWISIVTLLAVFRFEAPPWWDPGPDGVNVKWAKGITTRPEGFPCEIKPRHENLGLERLAHLIALAAS